MPFHGHFPTASGKNVCYIGLFCFDRKKNSECPKNPRIDLSNCYLVSGKHEKSLVLLVVSRQKLRKMGQKVEKLTKTSKNGT